MDGVIDFYRNLDDWTVTDEARDDDGGVRLTLERGADRAQVAIEPAAVTSGALVTRIVLTGVANSGG